jgi:hypothetical protein
VGSSDKILDNTLDVLLVNGGPAAPPQAHCILDHEPLRKIFERVTSNVNDGSHGALVLNPQLRTKSTGVTHFVRVSWYLS